jgi:integrase
MTYKGQARPKSGEPIKLVYTKSGECRYRTVLDYSSQGQNRKQRRQTFLTLTEARAHIAEVKTMRKFGSLPNRNKKTFELFVDEYLKDRADHVRSITHRTYVSALKPYVQEIGSREMGQISFSDIESIVRNQASEGKSKRTVSLGLTLTRSVFARAIREGVVLRNVAEGVSALGNPPKTRSALSHDEYRSVSSAAEQQPMAAAWILLLHGLRRSEVLGLQWQDIDLKSNTTTLTICRGRTEGNGNTTPPKTRQGSRILPLSEELEKSLRTWRASVLSEFGIAALAGDHFVFINSKGLPVRPEWLSDEWKRLCSAAGIIRNVVLHEARHTSVTMMRSSGVPDRIVAAWHGHDESTMRAVYDHPDQDHDGLLSAAAALSALRGKTA